MCCILMNRNCGKKEKKPHELQYGNKGSEAVGELAHERLTLNQALKHQNVYNKSN